jgi:hypothetical protein
MATSEYDPRSEEVAFFFHRSDSLGDSDKKLPLLSCYLDLRNYVCYKYGDTYNNHGCNSRGNNDFHERVSGLFFHKRYHLQDSLVARFFTHHCMIVPNFFNFRSPINRHGDTLVSIVVTVGILLTIGIGIGDILVTNTALDEYYDRENARFILEYNLRTVIRKVLPENIKSQDVLYLLQDPDPKTLSFFVFAGTGFSDYQYVDRLGRPVFDTGSFDDLLFRRCVRVVSIGKRLPTSIALEPIVTIV